MAKLALFVRGRVRDGLWIFRHLLAEELLLELGHLWRVDDGRLQRGRFVHRSLVLVLEMRQPFRLFAPLRVHFRRTRTEAFAGYLNGRVVHTVEVINFTRGTRRDTFGQCDNNNMAGTNKQQQKNLPVGVVVRTAYVSRFDDGACIAAPVNPTKTKENIT